MKRRRFIETSVVGISAAAIYSASPQENQNTTVQPLFFDVKLLKNKNNDVEALIYQEKSEINTFHHLQRTLLFCDEVRIHKEYFWQCHEMDQYIFSVPEVSYDGKWETQFLSLTPDENHIKRIKKIAQFSVKNGDVLLDFVIRTNDILQCTKTKKSFLFSAETEFVNSFCNPGRTQKFYIFRNSKGFFFLSYSEEGKFETFLLPFGIDVSRFPGGHLSKNSQLVKVFPNFTANGLETLIFSLETGYLFAQFDGTDFFHLLFFENKDYFFDFYDCVPKTYLLNGTLNNCSLLVFQSRKDRSLLLTSYDEKNASLDFFAKIELGQQFTSQDMENVWHFSRDTQILGRIPSDTCPYATDLLCLQNKQGCAFLEYCSESRTFRLAFGMSYETWIHSDFFFHSQDFIYFSQEVHRFVKQKYLFTQGESSYHYYILSENRFTFVRLSKTKDGFERTFHVSDHAMDPQNSVHNFVKEVNLKSNDVVDYFSEDDMNQKSIFFVSSGLGSLLLATGLTYFAGPLSESIDCECLDYFFTIQSLNQIKTFFTRLGVFFAAVGIFLVMFGLKRNHHNLQLSGSKNVFCDHAQRNKLPYL